MRNYESNSLLLFNLIATGLILISCVASMFIHQLGWEKLRKLSINFEDLADFSCLENQIWFTKYL
jgi:hypothetical protein